MYNTVRIANTCADNKNVRSNHHLPTPKPSRRYQLSLSLEHDNEQAANAPQPTSANTSSPRY
jgi:hypothetical protein